MHAVVATAAGGPEVLAWQEVPDPEPGPGEVVLEVAATAVNRADLMQRQGAYPPPPGASEILGLECTGTVLDTGAEATGWKVGDRACALLAGGGYAERVAVPVGQLLPVPGDLSLLRAAALPEAVCTVWSNLFMVGRLRAGETVLVHGGAGGIGVMAVQVAKALGARVAVTAGSPEKLEHCAQLGADVLVDHRREDFVARVREATDGRGADVVLDVVGAKYLARNVEVLAESGRLVVIGLQGGRRAELDLAALLGKRAAVVGTTLRGRALHEKAAICTAVVEHVWPLVATGEVRPVIDRVLPIAAVAEAHRVVEASEHVGKVVLDVAAPG